ncbi:unnamed protein product [Heligmosomoides polygyrus]|uniref:Integrase_H2C2 domain-containing protein n=1 Tax=Heligmosomoides polygyrus TaxID=6339 RepID=A0A183GIL3_HELPZ|nr:unnamed protein product [Heligmosomoides polygyrus]
MDCQHAPNTFMRVLRGYKVGVEGYWCEQSGVWRSKGRLGNSSLHFDAKNPIFVTPYTVLSSLIIQEAHGNYHRGIEHTISTVREQYWIPKLRQQRIVFNVVDLTPFHIIILKLQTCRYDGLCVADHSSTLDWMSLISLLVPKKETRLNYMDAYLHTVTRLIHLEVVRSMAVGDFLNALRRFIARKGVPESITCDNAPTFLLNILAQNGRTRYVISVLSNVAVNLSSLQVTMTMVTLPPTPKLNSVFITDGNNTDDCKCNAAESKVRMDNRELREQLRDLRRQLREIQDAIPPLPNPEQFYDRIVTLCWDYHCTLETTRLEERLRHFRSLQNDHSLEIHDVE